jgi:hypothetical protein
MSAQALHLSSASAKAGEQVAIEISFKSVPGHDVSALQFEAAIPSAQLKFQEEGTSLGPRAQADAKALSCAAKSNASGTLAQVCILYGGQQPIGDGVIAVLRLKILPEAAAGTAKVRVDQALAVSKELKRLPMDPVETAVHIRK